MLISFSCLVSVHATEASTVQDDSSTVHMQLEDSIVHFAKQFLGTPYVWGGAAPGGFDCSGYVAYVYRKFGYSILRTSAGLANAGRAVELKDARKGDLILFRGTNPSDKSVGHIGIVISEKGEELHFIHASSSQKHFGVVITNYNKSGYPARFVGVRRML